MNDTLTCLPPILSVDIRNFRSGSEQTSSSDSGLCDSSAAPYNNRTRAAWVLLSGFTPMVSPSVQIARRLN